MDERKKRVLNAIIKDYITHAEPVGSRTITKKYDLGVSPATIRNEMSDLEEEGYIEQPHTSAGRIPSVKGYRYYVDNLMQPEQLSVEQKRMVREALTGELNEINDFMRSCCQMISRLTHYTSLASVPERGRGKVENLQLMPVNEHQLLVVMLASTGIVRHKLIDLPRPLAADKLAYVEAELCRQLIGKEMKQISYETLADLLTDMQNNALFTGQALELLEQALTPEGQYRIFTGGALNMLSQPEFRDVSKLRNVFSLLEEDNKMRELFSAASDQVLTVTIGGEMPVEGVSDCSMVMANYFINGEKAGSVGVLGPTRMSYDKTVSLMEFIAGELSKVMSDKKK